MLSWLRVENLVLVRDASLDLHGGLNAITGETGAGKTILAQSVGLLLGGRADASLVGPGGPEAYVEAAFSDALGALPPHLAELAPDGEEELVLARRLLADGRSRALAWGRSVSRGDLEEAGGELVDVVSQHEARRLARPIVQLELLDAAAGLGELRAEMAAAWSALAAARREADEALAGESERARALAEDAALAEAVESARPEPGEQESLAVERDRLRHVDVLYAAAAGAAERLNPEDGAGAVVLAGEAAHMIEEAAEVDATLEPLAAELIDAVARMRDVSPALRSYAEALEAEPGRLDSIEARLALLAELRQRFASDTLSELLERAAEARARLDLAAAGHDHTSALEAAAAAAEAEARGVAGRLAEARRAAAPELASEVEAHLADLGMADARLEVRVHGRELGARGSDAVELALQANPGLPAAPLAQAASGGELSRVALALRLASRGADAGETLVFDEVDAGIGGLTARALGEKLRDLARSTQVICITHLPQVAALADRHFSVVKTPGEPTETRIERLEGEAVLVELARMLGAEAGDADALALAASLRER